MVQISTIEGLKSQLKVYKSEDSFTYQSAVFYLNRLLALSVVPSSALSQSHHLCIVECSLFGLFTSAINKD